MTRYRWKIKYATLHHVMDEIETSESEPPTDAMAFTVTDELGRRISYCWQNIACIISEQIQERAHAPQPQ